jgi:hypothetical protein
LFIAPLHFTCAHTAFSSISVTVYMP